MNLATTQLQRHHWRWKQKTRYLVWSVLFPCLFYKLTLEGAIVSDSLRSVAHSEETGRVKKNTKLGGRTQIPNIWKRI